MKKSRSILIAAGIFPPDIGGPSTYAFQLANSLAKRGIKITVIAYKPAALKQKSISAKTPFKVIFVSRNGFFLMRWLGYARAVQKEISEHDLVYSFCPVSVSLPVLLFCNIKKPIIVRLGGDFLWEAAVAKARVCTLQEFYKKGFPGIYEKIKKRVFEWSLQHHDKLIFTTDFLRTIFVHNYRLQNEKIAVINNPYPEVKPIKIRRDHNQFLFIGRLIPAKNIERLLRVWTALFIRYPNFRLKIIGDGPTVGMVKKFVQNNIGILYQNSLSHDKILKEIAKARALILPMLTEISPNLGLEATALSTPILCTYECGIKKDLYRTIYFKPLSDDDFLKKWLLMCDDKFLNNLATKKIRKRSWENIVDETLLVLQT
ncbi:MAG: glycosyltransferase family 4 protein [Patescibacteria group bacterium]|nr:glycosyltransferase family 4 protein [Patescibacteria group bacterium]